MKGTLGGGDGSKGRTDYQEPGEAALLQGEEGPVPAVSSGWAETQPETRGIETALVAPLGSL